LHWIVRLHRLVHENGAVAVAADEALLGEGAAACLEARAASIFVVKPAALGGVEASVAIFGRARQLGIRVVWSSLIDGAVGRMTAVAIAAGLGDDDPERVEVHGLGTADLLSRDLVAGCEVKHGLIETNSTPGLGCPIPPIWEEGEYATEKELGEAWVVEVAN
jgi:L-alanine-DL-glutamate epimerase-like enolase superfamily enzyme